MPDTGFWVGLGTIIAFILIMRWLNRPSKEEKERNDKLNRADTAYYHARFISHTLGKCVFLTNSPYDCYYTYEDDDFNIRYEYANNKPISVVVMYNMNSESKVVMKQSVDIGCTYLSLDEFHGGSWEAKLQKLNDKAMEVSDLKESENLSSLQE